MTDCKTGLAAAALGVFGLGLIVASVVAPRHFPQTVLYIGIGFFGMAVFVFLGARRIAVGKEGLTVDLGPQPETAAPPPKLLSDEEIREKRHHAELQRDQLPGGDAGQFQLLEESLELTVAPRADPLTPMYVLDKDYRIIDWNTAFSICFDRTMEGRIGHSVLEWTYFLDNYQDVLQHGIAVFGPGKPPPVFDKEEIHYTSHQYGAIVGTKRAYQIPGDDGQLVGWLITIKPSFRQREMALRYQGDLFAALRKSLMWSEYALCYDKVLTSSDVYPELIGTLLGEIRPGPPPIAAAATVLEIGAGTGNITERLAEPSQHRRVVAIDNNPVMLGLLRQKCERYLSPSANAPGVIPIKQDASSLFGLGDDYFDYVIDNNFLYSLDQESVKSCLREVLRVLRPGGELRLSEPQRKTDVLKVLDRIERDLKRNGSYGRVQREYLKLRQINELQLAPLLNRWDLAEMETLLVDEIGFADITYAADDVYAGQSILVCARKAANSPEFESP
jgi:ubiquinone/menaquinone biosynthesis C-methylase UbiE